MESINILCFGDSLTEGYTAFGSAFTPYAKAMESRLKSSWPSTKINVDVEGMSGDMVDEDDGLFLTRIKAQFAERTSPYDFVVILGGTNDLGRMGNPKKIFSGLEKVYAVARNHGASILALTVPECSAKVEWLDENRNELNELIKGRSGERFYVLDLYALIPYHSMDLQRRKSIWDDGLHFKPKGYDLIGQEVANKLIELLAKIENPRNLKLNAAEVETEAAGGIDK